MSLRVGLSCQLLVPRPFGVAGWIGGLARALVATNPGHELVLYTRPGAPLPEGLEPPGPADRGNPSGRWRVSSAPAPAGKRLGRIVWEQTTLPRRARRDGLDAFHAPGYVMPLRMRVPTVLTLHDLLVFTHPEFCTPSNRAHYRLLVPPSIRRARRVLTLSHAVRDEALARFGLPPERVEVVPPGVAEGFFAAADPALQAELRARYDLPERFALFPGNLEPKKNLARLVDAFARARLDGELVLTGGGGWGDVLAGRAGARGLRRLPYVPARWLPELVRMAWIVAFPSLAEGFGLPVIEALASGTPLVCAAEVPALADADFEAAVRVDPRSVDSIADGLARAWGDEPLRARLAARGRAAAERFRWEESARRTWRVYEAVAREGAA